MNKTILNIIAALVFAAAPLMAVPSGINYQGALTDDQGNPFTGTRTMSIKLYDAAAGGTLLYSEDIGVVDVSDGVFSFEFGTSGTSNAEESETVGTTDGTAATFQKILSASEVVAGSVAVSDGTYTWSQSSGSSNEDDFGVAYSTSLRRVSVTYFNGAPAAGQTITATYRTPASGISGALAGDNQPWAEITVDGVAQIPRQKVLAVPFALRALSADDPGGLVAAESPSAGPELAPAFTTTGDWQWPSRFSQVTPDAGQSGSPTGFGAVLMSGNAYLIGGSNRTNAVRRLNLETGAVSRMADLPINVKDPSIVQLGRKLYSLGGYVAGDFNADWPISNMFIYDIDANTWMNGPNMPDFKGGGSAVVLDGSIYYVGGDSRRIYTSNGSNHTKVYKFNVASNTWSVVADALGSWGRPGLVVKGGKLYAIGALGVHRYDPTLNSWQSILNVSLGQGSACPLGETALFVSGTKTYQIVLETGRVTRKNPRIIAPVSADQLLSDGTTVFSIAGESVELAPVTSFDNIFSRSR